VLTTSSVQAYNVRAAWALQSQGEEFNESRWSDAARRMPTGRLRSKDRMDGLLRMHFLMMKLPLLHTIGYVLEGLLGIGEVQHNERYVRAAMSGVEPLIQIYKHDGLKGRYDEHWQHAYPGAV